MTNRPANSAVSPARGFYADGFEPVARCFASQLERGEEVGASFSVYHRGEQVVDLWGGTADVDARRPWERDTRIVVFSVTKGFAAMAMHLLADRGAFDWDEPVEKHWPGFGTAGKQAITIRTLLNHRGALPYLDVPLTLDQCCESASADKVLKALEAQKPAWAPQEKQAYHALTFGLYVAELFQRIAGEPLGSFLRRELFEPLGSDVMLGTPASEDAKIAALYSPSVGRRLTRMAAAAAWAPDSTESRVARAVMRPTSTPRRAFGNPSPGKRSVLAYNDVKARRAELAWASATASADGVARAYLPFAGAGSYGGKRYLRAETLWPVYERQSWSSCDETLNKPLGWSQGFLKEERHLFSPNPESYGHAGMGGGLGWCDPVADLAIGYVMNHMDWRVRSPRILGLCRSLYECEPLCVPRR